MVEEVHELLRFVCRDSVHFDHYTVLLRIVDRLTGEASGGGGGETAGLRESAQQVMDCIVQPEPSDAPYFRYDRDTLGPVDALRRALAEDPRPRDEQIATLIVRAEQAERERNEARASLARLTGEELCEIRQLTRERDALLIEKAHREHMPGTRVTLATYLGFPSGPCPTFAEIIERAKALWETIETLHTERGWGTMRGERDNARAEVEKRARRTAKLDIRTLPTTLDDWRRAARRAGVSLTEWVEHHLNCACGADKIGGSS